MDATRDALRHVNKQLDNARDILAKLCTVRHRTTGHAFLVFQLEQTRDRFLQLFNRRLPAIGHAPSSEVLRDMGNSSAAVLGFDRCAARDRHAPQLESASGRHVKVSRAPEPSDVLWENLEVKQAVRGSRQTLHTFLIALLLVLSTIVLYTTRLLQLAHTQYATRATTANPKGESDMQSTVLGLGVTGLNSVVTLIFNAILQYSIEFLTKREAYPTRTELEKHQFTRLIFAYLVNTLIVPIVVSMLTLYDPEEQGVIFYITGVTQARRSLLSDCLLIAF